MFIISSFGSNRLVRFKHLKKLQSSIFSSFGMVIYSIYAHPPNPHSQISLTSGSTKLVSGQLQKLYPPTSWRDGHHIISILLNWNSDSEAIVRFGAYRYLKSFLSLNYPLVYSFSQSIKHLFIIYWSFALSSCSINRFVFTRNSLR